MPLYRRQKGAQSGVTILDYGGIKFPLPIGARAVSGQRKGKRQTGPYYTANDYLIESLATPRAYIVEGFKNEMAVVYAPPISLSMDEIKAVVSYLQSQGGEVNIDAINNPTEVFKKLWDKIALQAQQRCGETPDMAEEVF